MAIFLYYSEPEEVLTDTSSDASSEDGLLEKADGHGHSRSQVRPGRGVGGSVDPPVPALTRPLLQPGERTPILTSPRIGQGRLHSLDKPHGSVRGRFHARTVPMMTTPSCPLPPLPPAPVDFPPGPPRVLPRLGRTRVHGAQRGGRSGAKQEHPRGGTQALAIAIQHGQGGTR